MRDTATPDLTCHACMLGLPGLLDPDEPHPVFGMCVECGQYVCAAHAECDSETGRVLCLEAILNLLARSAGFDSGPRQPIELAIADVADYRRRFPDSYACVHRNDPPPDECGEVLSMVHLPTLLDIDSPPLFRETVRLHGWLVGADAPSSDNNTPRLRKPDRPPGLDDLSRRMPRFYRRPDPQQPDDEG